MNESSNFLGGSVSNRHNVRTPIQFRKEGHCYQTSQLKAAEFSQHSNQQATSYPSPQCLVDQIQVQNRKQRSREQYRMEGSIISIDSSITDNIVRKIINVQQEKCRSKNRTLRAPTFTGYACEDFPSRTTRIPLLLRKEEIRPKARLKFVKKTISMPNPVKSLGYIKYHNLSSPRSVKSPSNSIRYNCEKISS